jgi:hypothetical protein
LFENKTKDEILDVVERASKDERNNVSDCFVCCIGTHGHPDEWDHFWAEDETYEIKELLENFKVNECKALGGKPKLFFIQVING